MGEQAFKYALFPHVHEGVMAGKVAKHALAFNNPLIVYQHRKEEEEEYVYSSSSSSSSSSSGSGSDLYSVNRLGLFAIGRVYRDVLTIDAMKLAEDDSGDVILRVVEVVGTRGVAPLLSTLPHLSVRECGMDEGEVAAAMPTSSRSVLVGSTTDPPSHKEEEEEGFHSICSIIFQPFQIISLRISTST